MIVEPIVTGGAAQLLVALGSYLLVLGCSGRVVRYIVLPVGVKPPAAPAGLRFDPSTVIGKCENVITVTFVLAGDVAGIAIVFAAKSLVRSPQIRQNAAFYLGGTLVNLVWGLLIAVPARVLIAGVG